MEFEGCHERSPSPVCYRCLRITAGTAGCRRRTRLRGRRGLPWRYQRPRVARRRTPSRWIGAGLHAGRQRLRAITHGQRQHALPRRRGAGVDRQGLDAPLESDAVPTGHRGRAAAGRRPVPPASLRGGEPPARGRRDPRAGGGTGKAWPCRGECRARRCRPGLLRGSGRGSRAAGIARCRSPTRCATSATCIARAGRLAAAEACYAEALALYGAQDEPPPLDHANALRPMAILKETLGQADEARTLWQRARTLYGAAGIEAGVAECTEHLARLG